MTVKLICENQIQLPEKFHLIQNYPNPFNNLTIIPFAVAKSGHVRIVIYNTIGKRVRTLIDQTFLPGRYRFSWDGTDGFGNQVASGVYICKACHPTGIDKIKIIYMK
jgi:flagellar hook assembly protein FlgD